MIFTNPKAMLANLNIGELIGITSGCFDLIHTMHVEYLNRCRKLCDRLFVILDSDRLILENKNKTSVIAENERAIMVDNLKAVNGGVYITDTIDEYTRLLKDIAYLKGQSNTVNIYKNKQEIYGTPLIEIPGVKNVIVPDITRFNSTTDIINFLKAQ